MKNNGFPKTQFKLRCDREGCDKDKLLNEGCDKSAVTPLKGVTKILCLSIHLMIAFNMSFSSTWTSVALCAQTVLYAYIIGLTEESTKLAGFFGAILIS